MILLCVDGSDGARAAIDHAGRLLSGQPATVRTGLGALHRGSQPTAYGFGMTAGMVNVEKIDIADREGTESRAEDGARLVPNSGHKSTSARSCRS